MAPRGHGSSISVSSAAGDLVGGAAYGASKASLEAMTRPWAAEYSSSGVRLNAIGPGPVCTPTRSGPELITALRRNHADAPRRTAVGARRSVSIRPTAAG
jgi:NAD(P)-dependent dehydrogenase (short-subunit alcohol dehydrogenase family)